MKKIRKKIEEELLVEIGVGNKIREVEKENLFGKISSSINLSLFWCLKFLRKNYK